MKKLGFFQSLYNNALYFNCQGIYVIVYVNNLHIVRPGLPLINELKAQLAIKFKTANLGSTVHYLEMEICQNKTIIIVTETVYIDHLFKTYQLSNYNTASTPMVERLYLAPLLDNFIPHSKDISVYKQFTRSIQ